MLPTSASDNFFGPPSVRSNPGNAGQRSLAAATAKQTEALMKLATGSRINRAADDPAGLIAAEALNSQLAALEAETRASERASAIARTADGALESLSDTLVDARAAAVAAANTGGMSEAEQRAYEMEVASAAQAADRVAQTAEFNDTPLFDGMMTIAIKDARLELPEVYSTDLGIDEVSVAQPEEAASMLDSAIEQIASVRGAIGMFERESAAIGRASAVEFENITAARSSIVDTDYPQAAAEDNRASILQAVNVTLLASSNDVGPDRLTGLLG